MFPEVLLAILETFASTQIGGFDKRFKCQEYQKNTKMGNARTIPDERLELIRPNPMQSLQKLHTG
jgi:hypothetical protein